MNLGGILLVVLTMILALGFAAGVYALLAGDRARASVHPMPTGMPEEHFPEEELPPRDDAWKPEVWYSEAADGTLFPNQPSPSFRISADSSFQRAISRRDLEDQTAEGPTAPQLAVPARTSAPADHTPLSIPDEVEEVSEIPTVMMKIAPVKDDLPPTLKMRAIRRGHTGPSETSPETSPESETHTNGSTPSTGEIPVELGEMEAISFPLPLAVAAYEPIPIESEPEDPADTIVLEAVEDGDNRVDGLHIQEDQNSNLQSWPSNIHTDAETYGEEIPDREPAPHATTATVEGPGWTWILEEPEEVEPEEVEPEEVEPEEVEPEEPGEELLPEHEPEEHLERRKAGQERLEQVVAPEPSLQPETTGSLASDEQRYDRLLLEMYSQAIHLRYDEELDAIAVGFTNCPVMENSDVPWVFQTIAGKIQELFTADTWQPHGFLLDVAGLQVAPEAEAAWEMVLDGFVTQLCPEVAPRIALAIQYDSSARHNSGAEDEMAPELQRASSVTGQPRPLVVARSYDAALLLLQLMRREI